MHKVQLTSNPISSQLFNTYMYRVLALLGFMILLLISNGAFAADPNPFESSPTSELASCPANHKMYFIGANAPTSTQEFPVVSLPLNWTTGNSSRNFTFTEASGNKTFTINFPSIVEKNNSQGAPPFYGSINGSTSSAINLVHDSTSTVNNHILNISTNRSVSKAGYKIQDVDSLTSRVIVRYFFGFPIYEDRTPYAEQVDVSANGGRLTFNSLFHTANNPAPNTSIVTAIEGQNCSTGECNIDASWGYKAANSVLGLRHNNTINQTSAPHAVGYSNFYFCLAPPKLIVKKQLNGSRISDNDQFQIEVKQGDSILNSFTTTGSSSDINNNSSSVTSLVENGRYTIVERVVGGGNVRNYNANYTCNNTTTSTPVNISSNTLAYNDTTKTRSFVLEGVSYGDEITCTITNTPSAYTFTGFVFNDNGGISSSEITRQDITSTFTGNPNYFNGLFDSSGNNTESGIGASGLQVRLTNCGPNGDTNIAGTTAQNIPASATSGLSLGQYKFTVSASVIATLSPQKICVVQVEPSSWKDGTNVSDYSVDTTPNTREVNLVTNTFNYKTESDGSRNLDFGEVQYNNTSLVLIKSQYVHNCNINSSYNGTSNTPSQTPVFSIDPINNIEPGKCIAYKIEAYNRGHVDLTNIEITDKLQATPVKSVFVSPFPLGNPIAINNNKNALPVDTIISNAFNLVKPSTGATPTKATLYFNTKYGSTVNP